MDLDSHGFTDCENICLYAGRIRILWPMLGGGVSSLLFLILESLDQRSSELNKKSRD